MIELVKLATAFPCFFKANDYRQESGGAIGRRLITLLCAGWVPHDSVFVAEVPLSGNGRDYFSCPMFLRGFS